MLIDTAKPFTDHVVNLGCGNNRVRGAINVDIDKRVQPDVVADIRELPVKNGSIATVIANSVLEHVGNVNRPIREMARISKQGGKIILTVPTDADSPQVRRLTWVLFKVRNNFGVAVWTRMLATNNIVVKKMVRYQSRQLHLVYVVSCVFLPLLVVSTIFLFLLKRVSLEGMLVFMECEKIGC